MADATSSNKAATDCKNIDSPSGTESEPKKRKVCDTILNSSERGEKSKIADNDCEHSVSESHMSALRQQVTCPVCLDIPRFGGFVTCPNGHLVCHWCFNQMNLREKTNYKPCPTCRSKYGMYSETHKGLHGLPPKSPMAEAILNMVKIKCRWNCGFSSTRNNTGEHEDNCSSAKLKCPFNRCKEINTYSEMFLHILKQHIPKVRGGMNFFKADISYDNPPHCISNEQAYMPQLLMDDGGTVHGLLFFEDNARLGQVKFWAYHMDDPKDRSKHKVKITAGHDSNMEKVSYVGPMYGGGGATMEFGDKLGLCLPDRMVRNSLLRTTEDGRRVLRVTYQLLSNEIGS